MRTMRHDAHFVEALNYMSETHSEPLADRITGLFTEPYFQLALKREIKRAERHNLHFSVVEIVLGNVLKIREKASDFNLNEFLRIMASKLRENVREIDLIARLDEEKLGLILPKTEKLGAYIITERINSLICNTFNACIAAPDFDLQLEYGFATYPEDGKEFSDLLSSLKSSRYDEGEEDPDVPEEVRKRRSDVRLQVKNRVHYLRTDDADAGREDFKAAHTKNFSSHGMLLETSEHFPAGLELIIKYRPLLSRSKEIMVVGRVMWSLKKIIDGSEKFEIGLMIIPENEAGTRKLRIF